MEQIVKLIKHLEIYLKRKLIANARRKHLFTILEINGSYKSFY